MINKILTAACLFFFLGTNNSQAQRPHEWDRFSVIVEGLGCPYCAYGLEKKFKELKSIKNPTINIETGGLTFLYPTIQKLSIKQVEEQVKAAGYTAIQVQITRANGETESSKTLDEQLQQEELQVAGNCNRCRKRIEKAAQKVKGVKTAFWDSQNELLTVSFDPQKTSLNTIAKAIAKMGHDNALAKAKNSTYNNLHACCLYRD